MFKSIYPDLYTPKYTMCGVHVRKLASGLAVFILVVSFISVGLSNHSSPSPQQDFVLFDEEKPSYTQVSIVDTSENSHYHTMSFIITVICAICVLLADKLENSVLYWPFIVVSFLNGIVLSAVFLFVFAFFVAIFVGGDDVIPDSDVRGLIAGFGFLFMCLIAFGAVLNYTFASIVQRARRYMAREVETGNVGAIAVLYESDKQKLIDI